MTGEKLAVVMFFMAILFILWQFGAKIIRCHYCGQIGGHEEHCPYSGSGTRMK